MAFVPANKPAPSAPTPTPKDPNPMTRRDLYGSTPLPGNPPPRPFDPFKGFFTDPETGCENEVEHYDVGVGKPAPQSGPFGKG